MYSVSRTKQRVGVVLPLERIQMACHLIPKYTRSSGVVAESGEAHDTLDTNTHFHFNDFASYFMFVWMDYWKNTHNS